MKIPVIAAIVLFLFMSCSSKNEETSVFWISGFKPVCDMGAGNTNCLFISKTDNLQQENWELFYSAIEGFEFEEGFIKKVKVLVTAQDDAVAADQTHIILADFSAPLIQYRRQDTTVRRVPGRPDIYDLGRHIRKKPPQQYSNAPAAIPVAFYRRVFCAGDKHHWA